MNTVNRALDGAVGTVWASSTPGNRVVSLNRRNPIKDPETLYSLL